MRSHSSVGTSHSACAVAEELSRKLVLAGSDRNSSGAMFVLAVDKLRLLDRDERFSVLSALSHKTQLALETYMLQQTTRQAGADQTPEAMQRKLDAPHRKCQRSVRAPKDSRLSASEKRRRASSPSVFSHQTQFAPQGHMYGRMTPQSGSDQKSARPQSMQDLPGKKSGAKRILFKKHQGLAHQHQHNSQRCSILERRASRSTRENRNVVFLPHCVKRQTPSAQEGMKECSSHYTVLGISHGASLSEIRQAFKQRALQTHPDKGGDLREFISVVKSMESLVDKIHRESQKAHFPCSVRSNDPDDGLGEHSIEDHQGLEILARRAYAGIRACSRDNFAEKIKFLPNGCLDVLLRAMIHGWETHKISDDSDDKQIMAEPNRSPRKKMRYIHDRDGLRHVRVQWANLSVCSGCTRDLAEAIEWHVAMMSMKATAQARLHGRRDDVTTDLLLEEEVMAALEAAPTLTLKFRFAFNSSYRHIYSPMSADLQDALLAKKKCAIIYEQLESQSDTKRPSRAACMEAFHEIFCEMEKRGRQEQRERELIFALTEAKVSRAAQEETRRLKIYLEELQHLHEVTLNESSEARQLQEALVLSNSETAIASRQLRILTCEQVEHRKTLLLAPPNVLLRVVAAPIGNCAENQQLLALVAPVQSHHQARPGVPTAIRPSSVPCPWISTMSNDVAQRPLGFLTLGEITRFRSAARSAAMAGDGEMFLRCKEFIYNEHVFVTPRRTRSGRSVSPAPGTREARLITFLAWPRHTPMFEKIDLFHAPRAALQNRAFQAGLSRMESLNHAVFLMHEARLRQQLVRALPRGAYVEFQHRNRTVGACGFVPHVELVAG